MIIKEEGIDRHLHDNIKYTINIKLSKTKLQYLPQSLKQNTRRGGTCTNKEQIEYVQLLK